jgi:hypothetical protein
VSEDFISESTVDWERPATLRDPTRRRKPFFRVAAAILFSQPSPLGMDIHPNASFAKRNHGKVERVDLNLLSIVSAR